MEKRDNQVLFFFLDTPFENMLLDETRSVFECRGIVSVKLFLRWENNFDPPSTSLRLG